MLASDPDDLLLGRMLTPIAEIRLGPGRADSERLMRRAASGSLLYTIRSAWRGIVDYLFPPHGLFRRDDTPARIYDPELLADLERARRLMATADVSPLTIAPAPRRSTQSQEAVRRDDERDAAEAVAVAPTTPAAAAGPVRATARVGSPVIDFDFQANERQQQQLREEAALAAEVVSTAMSQVREKLDALNAAREEVARRRELLEAGVMAEQALRPAEERLEQALAEWEA
ncbi:MAG: hypothetical protein AB7Y46_18115, partial [Armatimonadota bacterium]